MKRATGSTPLHVVSMPAPSALGAHPFPAAHVIAGAGSQARFIHALREAPVSGFSSDELGWERAPSSPIPVRLTGARDLDWRLDPSELEP
jgi:hypothetical protein